MPWQIFVPAITANVAIRKPRNIEPTVPARIRAGYILNTRKPTVMPIPITARMAIGGWYTSGFKLKKKIVMKVTRETLPHSPSSPSSQFMAFITRNIQKKRRKNDGKTNASYGMTKTPPKGLVIELMCMPKIKISTVRATWKNI